MNLTYLDVTATHKSEALTHLTKKDLSLLLPAILVIQLLLTFFCPSFAFNGFKVFFSDFFYFLWVPLFLVHQMVAASRIERKSLTLWVKCVILLFSLIYLHGFFKYPFDSELTAIGYITKGNDVFQPFKELMMAYRFMIWTLAGVGVSFYFSRQTRKQGIESLRKITHYFEILVILSGSLSVLVFFFPKLGGILGRIYGYDPGFYSWVGRVYGVFLSPMEAGTAFSLSILLLVCLYRPRSLLWYLSLLFGFAGVVLAKTFTPLLALVLAQVVWLKKVKEKGGYPLVLAFLSVPLSAVTYLKILHPNLFSERVADFLYRFKTWEVFLKATFKQFDYFIFGNGFSNYYTDNIYVFIFNRGGVLLLGAFLYVLCQYLLKGWKTLSISFQAVILFLLISGIPLDSLIFRPVVTLLICVLLPLFAISGV